MKLSDVIKVLLILGIHGLLSMILLGVAGASNDIVFSWGMQIFWGVGSAVFFLYLFTHDKNFRIARLIEKEEEKVEKKWLKRFAHSGKVLTTILIGIISGQVLGALSVRILLPHHEHNYILVALTSLASTIFYVLLSKGFFHLAF